MIDDDDRDELERSETPRSTSHGSSTRSPTTRSPATRSPAGDTIRDARLRELSSEHHAALVWARRLRRGVDRQPMAERFARELEPHFAIEETILAPALRACGEHALVDRLLAEHATLRRLAAADAHEAFGTALHDHVRFEERELFPRCEVVLAGDVLDAVLRASGSKR